MEQNNLTATRSARKQRGLNVLIVVVAIAIILLSRTGPQDQVDNSAQTLDLPSSSESEIIIDTAKDQPPIATQAASEQRTEAAESTTSSSASLEPTFSDSTSAQSTTTESPINESLNIEPTTEDSTPEPTPIKKTALETPEKTPLTISPANKLAIEQWKSSKGTRAYFVNASEIPMVDIRIIFAAGSSRDSKERSGAAKLTNGLLSEGTEQHSVDDIARQFESVGANFSNSAHRDMALVSLRSLSDPDYLTPAIEMLAEVIGRPTFPQEAFDRNLNLMQLNLQQEQQSPGRLLNRAFFAGIYPNHPYGLSPDGSEASLKRLTRNDIQAFYNQYYVAANAIVGIVGDISTAQAKTIVETITAHLNTGKPAPQLPDAPLPTSQQHVHIEFPSKQTHIIMGLPSIKRNNPITPHLYLANEVFGGGGFSSILTTEIRENRGLSYSSSSYYVDMLAQGPFAISLQTKNRSAKEAIEVIRDELGKFIEQGPSAEQLEQARNNTLASFPLQLANNTNIVSNLGSIGFYRLPLNYLHDFHEKIASTTIAEASKAFQQIVKADQLFMVTVGPENPLTPNE